MFEKPEQYLVECFKCDYQFHAKGKDIDIELDEGYSADDFWWIHIYTTYCPQCNQDRRIDILDDHLCCNL